MTEIISESYQKHYSVAIPFVDDDNILFQVRSEKLKHQPGDICFPGGAVEEKETLEEALIRELKEELLLENEQIEIRKEIGLLINDTAVIHCFDCRIHGYGGGFNTDEVSEILYIPINFFTDTKPAAYDVVWNPVFPEDFPFDLIHGGRSYGWSPRKSRIRFYEYHGYIIWGMTARIIEKYARERGNTP